jgi:hypothetical protein
MEISKMFDIEKCSIPIIWLDTSIMILLTKYINKSQKLTN